MRLILNSDDLKPEHKNTKEHITFDVLTEKAQEAVKIAGKAFFEYPGVSFASTVYPP